MECKQTIEYVQSSIGACRLSRITGVPIYVSDCFETVPEGAFFMCAVVVRINFDEIEIP